MDNHDIIDIQTNKKIQLHLGYVGGIGGSSGPQSDPVYTADKPNIALKSEIPTKVSQLDNDSGFISSIPQNLVTKQELDNKGYLTSFTQSDPIYTQDKPNIALKSELFSKSYNDLTDKPIIPSIDGLASEKYVNDKISAIKVPQKTSELTNDSGFITANEIPEISFEEKDPVYTADKPNLALKSELFSKSYNDLTDKPELYTPTSTGDGTKFLSDDGTYKTVETGGGSVDLSWYETTGNINFVTKDANENITNRFSQQAGYTQIGINKTNLIDIYGNYLKWYQQKNESYPLYGVDFSSATEFKLPENTTINGVKIGTGGSSSDSSVSEQIVRDLTFGDNLNTAMQPNIYYVNMNGKAVQRFSTSFTSDSSNTLEIIINVTDYVEGTCPTIQVMCPYKADITTFRMPNDAQVINLPESLTFDSTYTVMYAVFVIRCLGTSEYQISYSYSYGRYI